MNVVGVTQALDNTGSSLSSLSATRSVTAGDLLWLPASAVWAATPKITDTQGNFWQLLDLLNYGGHNGAHWWTIASKTGSNQVTMTAANSGTFTYPGMFVTELSGVNAVAGHNSTDLSGVQSGVINGTAITIAANTLPVLFLSCGQDNSANVAPLADTGAGWTSQFIGGNFFGTNSTAIESQQFSTGTSHQSAWTAGSGNNGYGFLDAMFYQAAGGAGAGAGMGIGTAKRLTYRSL